MKTLVLVVSFVFAFSTAKAQDPLLYSETWRLAAIQIEGEVLEIPANAEVANIFIDFTDVDHLNTVNTIVCNELFGNIDVLVDTNQLVFNNLTQTLISCELGVNAEFEAVYFDFFFLHEGEELEYDIISLLGQRSGDSEFQLIIYDGLGNKLEYSAGTSAAVADFSISALAVYPNPAVNTISWDSAIDDPVAVRIYSMQGALVQQITPATHSVNVSKLSAGMYFIEFLSEQGRVVKRFIKQ